MLFSQNIHNFLFFCSLDNFIFSFESLFLFCTWAWSCDANKAARLAPRNVTLGDKNDVNAVCRVIISCQSTAFWILKQNPVHVFKVIRSCSRSMFTNKLHIKKNKKLYKSRSLIARFPAAWLHETTSKLNACNPRSKIYTPKQHQEMHKWVAKTQIAPRVNYYTAHFPTKSDSFVTERYDVMMQVASKHCSYNLKRKLPFL